MNQKKELSQSDIKLAIDSNHKRISTWENLHAEFEKMRDTAWMFRGVSSPDYYPIPSIGREMVYGSYKLAHEKRLFSEFKNRAVSLVNDPRMDDWQWLSYAQHIGVPTRLMDWTVNPLVGLFFALEKEKPRAQETDRLIYAVKYSKFVHEVDNNLTDPFENKSEGRFSAPLAFERIRAQRGIFTIHPDPTKIFYPNGMKTILIDASSVEKFRRRLFKYGIDHWHIYPDAHGLGQQMAWHFRKKVGLGNVFSGNKYKKRTRRIKK